MTIFVVTWEKYQDESNVFGFAVHILPSRAHHTINMA